MIFFTVVLLCRRAQAGKPPGLNEKDLSDRLNRVKAAYGADKEDFSTFPKFSFKGLCMQFTVFSSHFAG